MKLLIIANWKCNPDSLAKAKLIFNLVQRFAGKNKKIEVVLCPPFLYLNNKNNFNFKIGAQNCFWEEKGAFTGEISAKMLKNIGCQYILIGHSERRRCLNESNEQINKKIKVAIEAKLSPILCVGESIKERSQGETKKILEKQVALGLKSISKFKIQNSKFSIAYEPIWAISTSKHRKDCSAEEIHIISLLLRKILIQKYGSRIANKIRILFGGNINSQNIKTYFKEAKVQGFLVGSASLNAKEFVKIIKNITVK